MSRLAPVVLIIALSAPLAGCGGGAFGGGFDPSDLFNFLDTKKPLPGDRRAVFPEGVPGVDRGVPPDLVKDSPGALAARQQIEQAQQPQPQPSPPNQPGATQAAVAPTEDAPPRTAPPPPAARPKAPAKRRSVTALPPDPNAAQQAPSAQPAQPAQPSAFPSPFSQPKQSGTFQQ